MEATLTPKHTGRSEAPHGSESLPVTVSEAPESTENTDAPVVVEALKTAPAGLPGSLPTALNTGSLPVTLPVTLPVAVVDPDDASTDDEVDDVSGQPANSVTRDEGGLWTDEELEAVQFAASSTRSIEEIMEQDGVTRNEAILISQEEQGDELEASIEAERLGKLEKQAQREAMEAEQAEADRLAREAEKQAILDKGEARATYRRSKRNMFISLTLGLALIAGFFLMGGL